MLTKNECHKRKMSSMTDCRQPVLGLSAGLNRHTTCCVTWLQSCPKKFIGEQATGMFDSTYQPQRFVLVVLCRPYLLQIHSSSAHY